ncbi:gamma-glutamylcyclotransferase family protein [Jiella avicenniae]|uniref:Gamma-glutamylcyclotransferase n=1 Tax=Jiella avicenniae TaxID=2907202 RepID=A0A9X1P0A2_9HYPH|nr:gamma-glutamylcyclotransferase family protein [Jiella avicenniae]MCE7027509.1 gamma-glutamylcyclotransferase [Jiella avicenniae]
MADYFAFYGTLMDGAADVDTPLTEGLVQKVGPCRLAGTLRDHGAYPGYFPAQVGAAVGGIAGHFVVAELHEILRPEAFAVFDAWENYDPADEAGSMYLRRKLPLAEPAGILAWVYVSQLPASDPAVPGGDWRAHRARSSG